MIRRMTIKNFKSLRHVTVELKPLTIIIGPNASGKSNLLDALEGIQRLLQYKGTTMPGQEGQQPTISLDDVLWRKAEPTEEIDWELHYNLPTDDDEHKPQDFAKYVNEYSYSIALQRDGLGQDAQAYISREKLEPLDLDDESPAKYDYFEREESAVIVQGASETVYSEISPTDLALHFYAQDSFLAVRRLQRYIQGWGFFKIIPYLIRSNIIQQRGKSRQLSKYGSNLANVLHYLREDEADDFEYIQEEMLATLHFSRLQTREENEGHAKQVSGGLVYLEAEEKVFPGAKPFGPDNLSDGTLGLLALLTVLGVSDLAPLICLEEPERSIHRQLIPSLASYLHDVADQTQLIVTTHSPEFLDHFDPYQQDYVQVLIAYRDKEGATQFMPIRQVPDVQEWLEDYMLGQVWTMGQIEEMLEVT